MTLPSTAPPPETTNPTARASAAVADHRHRLPPKSCHRPKIRQLKAVKQPSHPAAPVAPAARAKPRGMSRSEREEAAKITRPCSECGRRFWSWKALFGHMRCHPNRPWRGIEPPSDLPRRGPALVVSTTDRAPADEGGASDAEVEVATCLILLKGGQAHGSSGDEPLPPSTVGRGFKCSSCDKVFDTPHGLGGHRAGHAKSTRDASARKHGTEEGAAHRAIQLYKCDICSVSFSSGQALGGHMSSHWKEEYQHQVVAAHGVSSPTSRTGGRGFDLNLPATEEMQGACFPFAFRIDSDLKLPFDGLVP